MNVYLVGALLALGIALYIVGFRGLLGVPRARPRARSAARATAIACAACACAVATAPARSAGVDSVNCLS